MEEDSPEDGFADESALIQFVQLHGRQSRHQVHEVFRDDPNLRHPRPPKISEIEEKQRTEKRNGLGLCMPSCFVGFVLLYSSVNRGLGCVIRETTLLPSWIRIKRRKESRSEPDPFWIRPDWWREYIYS